jgi:hypothetical protein
VPPPIIEYVPLVMQISSLAITASVGAAAYERPELITDTAVRKNAKQHKSQIPLSAGESHSSPIVLFMINQMDTTGLRRKPARDRERWPQAAAEMTPRRLPPGTSN